ncbi:MAG TPA: tetratricopeptide repeat protein, partial [Sphingomicrobium sp.]|nr:tetratricopeptide repeat protein [Sphingomicrobium sp.]
MRFSFDSCVLDADRRELFKAGQSVAVEPQVFDLLHYLLCERDRVISKDELIETVWRGRIVSESTLSSRINAARKAVGDSGEQQCMIRTYPRRGIRFVGRVEEESSTGAGSVAASGVPPPSPAGQETGGEPAPGKPRVAVLAFRNISDDPAISHLAEGVGEDILAGLSCHRSLELLSASATGSSTGQAADVRSIGTACNAGYLVCGSLRQIGGFTRLTAQLFETAAGRHLWSEQHDLIAGDLRVSLDQAIERISASVEREVSSAERVRCQHKPPDTLQASDYLQLGLARFYRANREDNLAAQQLFRQAIALDPSLAQAHAFLSYAIVLAMVYFDAPIDGRSLDEAVQIARDGTELDERDAMIRFAFGRAMLAHKDYATALAAMRAAVELNPSMAIAHCGLGDSLAYEGRFDEALPHFQKAIELSPFDPQRWAFMSYRSLMHLFAGQYAQAAEWAEKATQVPGAHYWPYAHRVAALGHLGAAGEVSTAV